MVKLRTYGDMLARCIDGVTASLHAHGGLHRDRSPTPVERPHGA
jgi:hypothetical protein